MLSEAHIEDFRQQLLSPANAASIKQELSRHRSRNGGGADDDMNMLTHIFIVFLRDYCGLSALPHSPETLTGADFASTDGSLLAASGLQSVVAAVLRGNARQQCCVQQPVASAHDSFLRDGTRWRREPAVPRRASPRPRMHLLLRQSSPTWSSHSASFASGGSLSQRRARSTREAAMQAGKRIRDTLHSCRRLRTHCSKQPQRCRFHGCPKYGRRSYCRVCAGLTRAHSKVQGDKAQFMLRRPSRPFAQHQGSIHKFVCEQLRSLGSADSAQVTPLAGRLRDAAAALACTPGACPEKLLLQGNNLWALLLEERWARAHHFSSAAKLASGRAQLACGPQPLQRNMSLGGGARSGTGSVQGKEEHEVQQSIR